MVKVDLAAAAVEDLDRLILTLNLPMDTRERVRRSLKVLQGFPRLGRSSRDAGPVCGSSSARGAGC